MFVLRSLISVQVSKKVFGIINKWGIQIIKRWVTFIWHSRVRCTMSKHKVLYIGHAGEQVSERFSKHRYDIRNRPDNSELAKHFHEIHNINDNLNISKLQNNIKTAAARRYLEDKSSRVTGYLAHFSAQT